MRPFDLSGPTDPSDPSAHIDDETLALLALGEDVPAAGADAHLRGCAHCRAELDQLSRLVHTGRTVTAEDAPQSPPPSVWHAIVAGIGADEPSVQPRSSTPATTPIPAERPDELASRRRGRQPTAWRRGTVLGLAAAACVGLLAGALGTWVAVGGDPSDDDDSVVVLQSSLEALAIDQASGRATVAETDDGRVMRVSVSGVPDEVDDGGFYEVWLLDEQAERLVSLGNLGPGHRGTFTLPESLDLTEYPVVDVSVEPADGDPTHSAVSAVRGILS